MHWEIVVSKVHPVQQRKQDFIIIRFFFFFGWFDILVDFFDGERTQPKKFTTMIRIWNIRCNVVLN